MHTLTYQRRDAQHTVWVPAEPSIAGIENASDRLRSWAITSGVEHLGEPFVRFEMELCTAHMPVARGCEGDPEAGIEVFESEAVNVLMVDDVPFDRTRETLEALDGEVLSQLRHENRGPLEFHPYVGALISGALALPVDLDIAALPLSGRPPTGDYPAIPSPLATTSR